MNRETLTDADVKRLYARLQRAVFRAWAISVASVLGVVIWLMRMQHVRLAELPDGLTFVAFRVLLFPGLVLPGAAARLGLAPGVGSSGVELAAYIVLTFLFWGLVVPGILTAVRVYIWPK